jgi:hypothetical protein
MPINPNTNFTAGQILTADQANRWPRGVMNYVESTTTDAAITTEEVEFTLTFTAVANRNYKLTWYEPDCGLTTAGSGALQTQFRSTNVAGTILQRGYQWAQSSGVNSSFTFSSVQTFTAGSQTVVCTAAQTGGVTFTLRRGSGQRGFFLIEDIGPA